MKNKNNKIITIVGTTASGKTKLAVKLAKKYDGEIVNADSRQVYRGMDIGTGKDLNEFKVKSSKLKVTKIKYHLIDVVSPNTEFNLAKFQKLAYRAIDDILERGKLPIVVGGTGLYVQAIVDGYKLTGGIKPDRNLRKEWADFTVEQLFNKLKKENKKFALSLNESEQKNKQRLLRYIEVARSGIAYENKKAKKYDALIIGVTLPKDELWKKIYKRLIHRLEKEDMIGEVERLHKEGVSWKRLESFGLEYKYISLYLQEKLNYEEMVEKLFIAIRQFSKKQLTWLKRWEKQGTVINWIANINDINLKK